MAPVSIFISYSHRDEQFRDELVRHLSPLQRQDTIKAWHDRVINPGMNWEEEIDREIEKADIILLLVSADFISSDYCYQKEMTRALERHTGGKAIVIPIIIRHVVWQHTPLKSLQALPKDAQPVEAWDSRDKAWTDVVQGIFKVSENLEIIKFRNAAAEIKKSIEKIAEEQMEAFKEASKMIRQIK